MLTHPKAHFFQALPPVDQSRNCSRKNLSKGTALFMTSAGLMQMYLSTWIYNPKGIIDVGRF